VQQAFGPRIGGAQRRSDRAVRRARRASGVRPILFEFSTSSLRTGTAIRPPVEPALRASDT